MNRSKIYHIIISAFIISLSYNLVIGHDYVPGTNQDHPIMLKGGDLYTVASGVLKETDLIFENGRITAIGKNLTPPSNCEIIDVKGKYVYPGLIDPNTRIGLIEIGDLGVTSDVSENGGNNPDLQTYVGYNPDSEIIPTVRSNGVTTVLVSPGGYLLKGRSSLLNLDGWTYEDASEKLNLAMHLSFPSQTISTGWWIRISPDEQRTQNAENLADIYEIFETAKTYYEGRKAGLVKEIDAKLEAMVDVFDKNMPLFIDASEYNQMMEAIKFGRHFDLKFVLVGGQDSWKLTDQLVKYNIPVILSNIMNQARRQDEGYDYIYALPKKLADANVKFCLSRGGYSTVRNLPFQAGQAISYGLSYDQALRAVTLTTAEILGVDDNLGSLEIGKKATIVVSEGDIFDYISHNVTLEFIEGRKVDLDNKHKELYNKYHKKDLSRLESENQ